MRGWGIRNESIDDLVYVYIVPRMIRCLADILKFKLRQKYSWVVIGADRLGKGMFYAGVSG